MQLEFVIFKNISIINSLVINNIQHLAKDVLLFKINIKINKNYIALLYYSGLLLELIMDV